ncbi:MAG: hypothetical protein J6333_09540 [Planctomycetes bacterium]|nr:hypothetical protein [Planctomycetota bacterium]
MTSTPQNPNATAAPGAPAAPMAPSPELLARIDAMFVRHLDDPVMRLIHDSVRALAEEGLVRG